MRSRDNGFRRRGIEQALRSLSVGLLLWTLWRSVAPVLTSSAETVEGWGLAAALARWTKSAPSAVYLRCGVLPSATQRDWLVALRRAGSSVAWGPATHDPLPAALALDVEPLPDPRGVQRIVAAGPRGARIQLRDQFGAINSASAQRGIVAFRASSVVSGVSIADAGQAARGETSDSLILRRVLLWGRVGWESKFVLRALEDDGWVVDTHLSLAPGVDITQEKEHNDRIDFDTARYAAVVVLDSEALSLAQRAALERYVSSGGGLILASAVTPALAMLAPGRAGATIVAASPPNDSISWDGLALAPVTDLRAKALPLQRRGTVVAVAAWRVENGRVVQEGYDDTWRIRMASHDSGVQAHREWWGNLVSAVAYAPVVSRPTLAVADPAPFAATVEKLGLSRTDVATATRIDPVLEPWLFVAFLLLVSAEWASRRLRGSV